jgi:hypothetical protein
MKDEWISVKDAAPTNAEDVFICLSDETILLGRFENRGVPFQWYAYWNDGYQPVISSHRPVTHWMPLPEPPKQ